VSSRSFSRVLVVLILLIPFGLSSQTRGRRGGASKAPSHPEAFKGVVVTFDGTLKKLTKKEITIEASSNHELVTFRRNKTTKFLENDADIKPEAIDLEAAVTVDATEDVDLKLMAVSVKVGTAKKTEGELKPK
jgi:hypothetical protein